MYVTKLWLWYTQLDVEKLREVYDSIAYELHISISSSDDFFLVYRVLLL